VDETNSRWWYKHAADKRIEILVQVYNKRLVCWPLFPRNQSEGGNTK
jgi:hypothetical protein